MKSIEKYNLPIEINNKEIKIHLNNDSDRIYLFALLKSLVTWTRFIPISIYQITTKNNIIIEMKRNISRVRYLNFWEFLDTTSEDNSITYSSGENEHIPTIGWIINFRLSIEYDEFEKLLLDVNKVYEGLIKKINNKDEI